MSHLVSEIHTKAVARVTELRPVIEAAEKDVAMCRELLATAEAALESYRTELKGLTAILEAMGDPPAPETAVPPVIESDSRVLAARTRAKIGMRLKWQTGPKKWARYRLPPRVRLFLSAFGHCRGVITAAQIRDWYQTVNPDIQMSSLKQSVIDITGTLITKGIMRRVNGGYEITEKTPASAA